MIFLIWGCTSFKTDTAVQNLEPEIIDISIWQQGDLSKDPLSSHQPDEVDCPESSFRIEGTQFEIDHENGKVFEQPMKNPRPMNGVKAYLINEIQERAYVILIQSDWMVIRAWETKGAKPIPVELVTYRDQVREAADRKVIEVEQMETIEECEAYSLDEGWPMYVERPPYSRIQVLEAEKQRIEEMIDKRRRIAAIIAAEGKDTTPENEALNED